MALVTYTRMYLDFLGCWVTKGDQNKCVFCDSPAQVTLRYPALDEVEQAPDDVERQMIKVCKSHYDRSKVYINKSHLPVTLEELRVRFMSGARASKSCDLKGWLRSHSTENPSVWFGTMSVNASDFDLFQAWVIETKARFLPLETRKPMFSTFVEMNPELHPRSVLVFEEYLLK